jgi:hypothetical protein
MSSQSRVPPPPPPPPPEPVPEPLLELAPVTVKEALAPAEFPAAGPVIKSLTAMECVYVPAVALLTLKEMLHEPCSGIIALLKVTPSVPLLSPMFTPVQVVAGAGVLDRDNPLGSDTVIPDWVNANGLEFANVTVSTALVFTSTLVGANASVTDGAATVTVIGVTQAPALVPAEDGAVLTAPRALKLVMATLVLPVESVTVRTNVPVPVEVTLTVALAAPETICTAPLAVQA